MLGRAYVAWGRDTIAEAEGPLDQLVVAYSLAADRISSGLALLSPDDASYAAAAGESAAALRFIELYDRLAAVARLAEQDGDLAQRQADAETLVIDLERLRQEQPTLPGLGPLSAQALLAAAEAYADTQRAGTAGAELVRKGRGFCEQAGELDAAVAADAEACVERLNQRITALTAPTARPVTPTPRGPRQVLVVGLSNRNDNPSCLSIQVGGIAAGGWVFSIDGLRISGLFDSAGNARVCGLGANQEVTFSIKYPDGRVVPGGGGVPARGGDIFRATWYP